MRGPDFTIGMLVAFQMFAARVSQPMLKLVGLWQQFQQAAIAVRRLGDIMDVPAEPWTRRHRPAKRRRRRHRVPRRAAFATRPTVPTSCTTSI